MTSAIDATKPVEGAATTASVRANFAAAKSEIETLQTETAKMFGIGQTYSSPSISFDTPITNNTARPIAISVQIINSASGTFGASLKIDGTAWDTQYQDATTGGGTRMTTLQAIVKPGSSFTVTDNTNCSITATRAMGL